MEHCHKFVLVEPHKFEQLRQSKTEPSVITQTGGNASSLESLREECQYQSNDQQFTPGKGGCQNDRIKHTCSYCGNVFVKRTNYLRHIGLIHRVDVSGRAIDEATYYRYKSYNCKTNVNYERQKCVDVQEKSDSSRNRYYKEENTCHRVRGLDRKMTTRKQHISGQTPTKECMNKSRSKRTMSSEQKRKLRHKIAKTWLAY